MVLAGAGAGVGTLSTGPLLLLLLLLLLLAQQKSSWQMGHSLSLLATRNDTGGVLVAAWPNFARMSPSACDTMMTGIDNCPAERPSSDSISPEESCISNGNTKFSVWTTISARAPAFEALMSFLTKLTTPR